MSFLDRAVETAFRAAMLPARRRHVAIEITVLALITLAVLPIDMLENRDWQVAAVLRLGVVIPVKGLALYLACTARSDLRLDLASAVSFCTGFTVVVALGLLSPAALQDRYFTVLGAIALLYAAFSGQRTRSLGLTVGFVNVLFVLACLRLDPQMSRGSVHYAICIAAFSFVALGIRLYIVERAFRSAFLREQLLAAQNRDLDRRIGELDQLTKTDALTGLGNRRRMHEALVAELDQSAPRGRWLGLSIIDVDFFKAFNDTAGHVAGDACLRDIAGCLAELCRDGSATVARLGGEEFALVVPDASSEAMLLLGERARAAVAAMGRPHLGRPDALTVVTISVGVTSVMPFPSLQEADLLRAADEALYLSKSRGRNAVTGRPVRPTTVGQPVATERAGKRLAPETAVQAPFDRVGAAD